MDSAVEDIKSRLNIVDLVGGYVQLQKAGANWKARCPFHNEKSPSFMVNEEKQIFHCFGCGKGGDIFRFLMEIDGLEFKEALKILADRAGVKLEQRGKPESSDKKTILDILELSVKFYEKQLWDGAGKDKILKYLRDRGFKDETIRAFRLGYAPAGWRNLLTFLTNRGYKPQDIMKTGLLVQKTENNEQRAMSNDMNTARCSLSSDHCYDRFRDRITFPIFDVMGKAIGFSARVSPGGDESQAKYVNTPETSVYSKSYVLYGIDKAKQEMKSQNCALLVEGNLDVIASHQAGIKNTIAVSGTALTSQQLDIIKRYTPNIKMFFDMDTAGKNALERSAELCFEKDLNAYVVVTDAGKDAAEIVQKDPAVLLQAVEKSAAAMQHFINEVKNSMDVSQPASQKEAIKKLISLWNHFSNPVEKDLWIKKIAVEFEVAERAVRDMAAKSIAISMASYHEEPAKKIEEDRSRLDMLVEKICGLMINYPVVWKEMAENPPKDDRALKFLQKQPLFEKIVSVGMSSGFSSKNINSESDPEAEKLAAKIFFRWSEENGENISEAEARLQLEKYLKEICHETAKIELVKIAIDLKKAEADKDVESKKYLMDEFNRICLELK
jgi:DNA primase